MYEPNVQEILRRLGPQDLVLDIGGWARPFNRANWVLDAEPYKTRGYYGKWRPAQGGERECFTKDTWVQRDICDKAPFPFGDKEFEFAICSHTLEDVRDPLWVCSEMIRVAKRGYIEVPSRLAESCRGTVPGIVGWTHHRWLIDIEANHLTFLMKYHTIHSDYRFALPASFLRGLSEERQVCWLFWEGSFGFEERTIHGVAEIARELEGFITSVRPYSAARLTATRVKESFKAQLDRVRRRVRRRWGLGDQMGKLRDTAFRAYHGVIPEKSAPRTWAMRQLVRMSNGRVVAGPFASMRYVSESVGSVLHAKILGTYELELHGVIDRVCATGFDRIVDVGAAEGYYAVGLAMRCPAAQVIAFELDPHGRVLLERLSSLNQVGARVEVRGKCDRDGLRSALEGCDRVFILMDAEGAEQELLDPSVIDRLRDSTVLVELHEHCCPGIAKLLRNRFGQTHSIEEFDVRVRTRADLPDRSWPYWWWMLSFTNECRPVRQSWLLLAPQSAQFGTATNLDRSGQSTAAAISGAAV